MMKGVIIWASNEKELIDKVGVVWDKYKLVWGES